MKYPTASLSIGLRVGFATALLVAVVLFLGAGQVQAREGNRTLKLYFGHTQERGEFTFKRNGRYDRGEINRINTFLRDWRKNEPAKMDPQLLDLVWAIHRETGSREYIHVVSAYRSPGTNEMLRSRSSGVAKNSQHTQGRAMDFFIPGVPLDKLRAIAMKMQGGGVGYYPKSGSPFVHADTGNVRAWPRMSRQQLVALFPNGNTLHLPADGKPLPGYERAVAQRQSSGATTLAYLETESEDSVAKGGDPRGKGVGRWLKNVFDGGADQVEDDAANGLPIPTPPGPVEPGPGNPQILIGSAEPVAEPRLPRARPGSEMETALAELRPAADATRDDQILATLAFAPLPRTRPDPAMLAASLDGQEPRESPLVVEAEDAIAALTALAPPEANVTPAPQTADSPVQLAFAAAGNAIPTSEADRAIIAAFAASAGAPAASVTAPAAVAAAQPAPQEQAGAIGVIFAAADLVSTASAAAAPLPEAAPVERTPTYDGDQAEMLELIATPAANKEDVGAELAMPVPGEANLYAAPDAAISVEGLNGEPELPVDRFATAKAQEAGSSSFFAQLFSGLVN